MNRFDEKQQAQSWIFDRATYMTYMLKGLIMERDSAGNVFCCDHIKDAMDASETFLEEGGVVTLSVSGKPFSTVELSEGGDYFQELPI